MIIVIDPPKQRAHVDKEAALSEFKQGRGYTRDEWDEVNGAEASDEQLAEAKPLAEVFPGLAATRGRGRPPFKNAKVEVFTRLDPDVLAKFRDAGRGWQARVSEALRAAKV